MSKMRLAMLLFVASEAVFFLVLILAYVAYHAVSTDASQYLDIPRTVVFTACLIFSSFTMHHAGSHLRTGNRRPALVWLFATIALGTVFLVGQGTEYAFLIKKEVVISRDLFGTTFYTLTGFHGLHVFIGLIMLATLFGLELRQKVSNRFEAVESVSIYWHFVDAVWMVIFPVIYLWVLL